MRITLKTDEMRVVAGLFKKQPAWEVKCTIEFSEEEKQIIKQRGLGATYVYTREFGPNIPPSDVPLSEVVKSGGISTRFLTPIEAKNFEHELKAELLPKIKSYIAANESINSEPETFEL